MSKNAKIIAKSVGLILVMPLWSLFAKIATMDSDIGLIVGFFGFGLLALFVGMTMVEFVQWLLNYLDHLEKETTK